MGLPFVRRGGLHCVREGSWMQWRYVAGALVLAVIAFLAVTLGVSGFAFLRRHEAADAARQSMRPLRP